MKIVLTKDEFARLVRACECTGNGINTSCYNCVMFGFCQEESHIEDFCEIETIKE